MARSLSLLLLACVSALCLAAQARGALLSASTPYTELVAQRYTAAGAPRVAQWPALCGQGVVSRLAGLPQNSSRSGFTAALLQSSQGAAVLRQAINSRANMVAGAPAASQCAPLPLGVSVADWAQAGVAAWPTPGAADGGNVTLAIATPSSVYIASCQLGASLSDAVACYLHQTLPASLTAVNAIASSTNSPVAAAVAVLATDAGLYQLAVPTLNSAQLTSLDPAPAQSVAVCGPQRLVVAGDAATIRAYVDGKLTRFEWVTNHTSLAGGVYDGPANSLVCDESDGTVFAAIDTAVNIRAPDGLVSRIDYGEGLPVNQSTHVALEPDTGALWIGSAMGLVRWSRGKDADADFRFFYGPRYLAPGDAATTALGVAGNVTFAAVAGGVTVFEPQVWTLSQKSDHYRAVLNARHDRVGQVAECLLQAFGDVRNCTQKPSDNNGLWTSLIVVAEAALQALAPAEGSRVAHFLDGMTELLKVTGVRGLMARSALAPGSPLPSPLTDWHNSTVPAYKGWIWKGDSSSDEVVGHNFAYPAVVEMLGASSSISQTALQFFEDITGYILENDYYLIDVTGNRTTWGVWNPEYIDYNPTWSDNRGVNSLQIIAYIEAVLKLSSNQTLIALANKSLAELTNATNQYLENIWNVKIESPDDNNYSDDELTFLPFYTLLRHSPAGSPAYEAASIGMERTWQFVRPLRSSLWNTIYIACGGKNYAQADIDSIGWNLRTWPLDLINWTTQNSQRRDIVFDPNPNRNMEYFTDGRTVLPAYERTQQRWNADPYTLDGGNGFSEGDPGVWLAPFWLARYHGIIAP